MTYKCIIVEDEPIAQGILLGYAEMVPQLEVVQVCGDAVEALQYLNELEVDILFLDIGMPKISGLDFLKTLSNPPATILTTAYRQYAVEGFELNVVDYLLKPFSFERFLQATNKVILKTKVKEARSAEKEKDFVFFKVDKKNVRVRFSEILYLEADRNYASVYLRNDKLVVYGSLSDIEKLLPADRFLRIHRSYLVSLKAIDAYGKDFVDIADKQLTVGNTYRASFFRSLKVFENGQ